MNNGTVTPRMVAAWAETNTATLVVYLGFSGNLHWTGTQAVFTPPPEGVELLRFDVAGKTFVALHVAYAGTLQRAALDGALGVPARVTGSVVDYDVAKNGGVVRVTATFDDNRLVATRISRTSR